MHTGLIAIIDDDLLDRFILKKLILLTCGSCQTIEFGSGFEALEYLQANAANQRKLPDIILFDIRMPLLNGWQYLERFSELKPRLCKKDISHYACSSSIDRFDTDFRTSHLQGYFVKPVSPENVAEAIERHTTSASLEIG